MAPKAKRRPLVTGGAQGVDQLCSVDRTIATTNAAAQVSRPIASIRIGRRHRRDLGDVDGLAASIADVGLLHPVVVTVNGNLIAGARRLEACRRLGWADVPVTVVELDQIVRGEFAENAHRKDFLPSEIDAIRRAMLPLEKVAAGRRMKAGTLAKVSQGSGRATDKIGAFAGVSGRTVEKIAAVVDAAKAEPKRFGKLLADMDRTSRVNGAYKRLCVTRQAAQIRAEPPPLPGNGPYRVVVADPPWPYDLRTEDLSHRGVRPYPTMSIEQICAMDVASLAHDDCILWLWVTNFNIRAALNILDAWGFEQKTMLTWVKDRMGTGIWLRHQSEHCLLATRGRPAVTLTNQTTVLHGPTRAHSQKPVEFYDFVESLCPAPRYCDLFSRYRHNVRWDCHGDEAPGATALDLVAADDEAGQ
jgi:N6-adenosine-specific RNA methylase IME4